MPPKTVEKPEKSAESKDKALDTKAAEAAKASANRNRDRRRMGQFDHDRTVAASSQTARREPLNCPLCCA
jgi:hypothetical protein